MVLEKDGMVIDAKATGPWIEELGYSLMGNDFIRDGAIVDEHPFAPELRSIFRPERGAAGEAVLCLDQVPTVCLVAKQSLSDDPSARKEEVREFCERLWNQNLIRTVLVAGIDSLEVWSVDNPRVEPESFSREQREEAERAWSVTGLVGGDALQRRGEWFAPKHRVDKILLDDILELVAQLSQQGCEPAAARRLIARLIFIVYLEDRAIIGETYRNERGLRPFIDLIYDRDRAGLQKLIEMLKTDFNGDFLTTPEIDLGWENLPNESFFSIHEFLIRTALRTGQKSFWRYDFSQIPIELIASIYETFLASEDLDTNATGSEQAKRRRGAYYTPKLLADWMVNLATKDRDLLGEKIFDGACGSGMLLTAAYRRLIRTYEMNQARKGKASIATFDERSMLLTNHIFGGDTDEDACQLTAFSLYLALLSELTPRDLEKLRIGGKKLPTLTKNIRRGKDLGNFFGEKASEKNERKFSIFLSNPPWRRVSKEEPLGRAIEDWRSRQPKPTPHIPKGQVAAAFALGASDTLMPDGRVAIILPVSLFTSTDSTHQQFRAHLLGRYYIEKIINFSDMRHLIFSDADHPFMVLIAKVRERGERFSSIQHEHFEYWTPKSDIALAFGRLTIYGKDCATLSTSALIAEDSQLSLRYWGGGLDIALLEKMKVRGTIADLLHHGWSAGKGLHLRDEDRRRPEASWYRPAPSWMKTSLFLSANALPRDLPFVIPRHLQQFPFEKIARPLTQDNFTGPRVLWPDGAHPIGGVKAVYSDREFTHKHTIARLSAPKTKLGRQISRFLAAYFRSPLGLWLLLLLSSTVASERPKLHLKDALKWPFWLPERHPQPELAYSILSDLDSKMASIEEWDEISQVSVWANIQPALNEAIYNYFLLSENEIAMVEELAKLVGSSLQPSSLQYKSLVKPLRSLPGRAMLKDYARVLNSALCGWRDATGGKGKLAVSTWTGRNVPLGAAVITIGDRTPLDRFSDDSIIESLADSFKRSADRSLENLLTIPEIAVVEGPHIFLVKPLVSRFWMHRCALEDANNIALQLQQLSSEHLSA